MSQTSIIHARIDPETKAATEKILHTLGMTPTEAIRLFYRQIALRKSFPLEMHIPNAETAETLLKSGRNEDIETFKTAEELYKSWD